MIKNYKQLLKKISIIFIDVDGVLTDGSVIIDANGEQLRTMNVKDGYALQLASRKGYRIVILSGGRAEVLRERFKYLGVDDVFLGVNDKIECFNNFITENNINISSVLYMGDDIPDYEVMKRVAVASCPSDAAEEIKSICHYISPFSGGKGCVRDILEQILKVQGKWFDKDAFKW